MRTLFLLLLSCLTCLAQFGVEQPMFQLTSASAYSVTNDPRMQYYWNYQDLDIGRNNTWTDRVQHLIMTSFEPANGPTNTADGLYFHRQTTRTSLTNTPLDYGTNQAVCFIWKPLESLNSFANFASLTNGSGSVLFNTPQSVGDKWRGSITVFDAVRSDTNYVYTNFHDLTLSFSNLTLYCFTNGVLSSGTVNTAPRDFFALRSIGQNPYGSVNYIGGGYVREVMVLTNVGDPSILATNVHYYRTNTYGDVP